MILYAAECATQVALDGIQCFGEWPPLPLPGVFPFLEPDTDWKGFLSTSHFVLKLTTVELLLPPPGFAPFRRKWKSSR